MRHAQTIVNALGYAGGAFPAACTRGRGRARARGLGTRSGAQCFRAGELQLSRTSASTLEFAHRTPCAPRPRAAGRDRAGTAARPGPGQGQPQHLAPLCMACVGACPASRWSDGRDQPLLKFIERNCVQCGLCVDTCPEKAITLAPRLLLTRQAKAETAVARGRTVQLRALRQALWQQADGGQHALGQAGDAPHVRTAKA